MKKILIVIMLLFCSNVQALDQNNYSEFTENKIEETDLIDVKVERRYKFYKEVKELGGYFNNEEYSLIDRDDYIIENESPLSIIKPEEKENRIINTYEGYHYKKAKDLKYLIVKAKDNSNIIKFKNLKFNYNKDLNYSIEYYKSSKEIIEPGGYIKFNFAEPINHNELKFSFDLITNNKPQGNIDYYGLNIMTSNDTQEITTGTYTYDDKDTKISWVGGYVGIYADAYEDYFSLKEENTSLAMKPIKQDIPLYTYQDKQYRHYRIVREYYPDYLLNGNEEYNLKDENDYKDYYAKRMKNVISKNNEFEINEQKAKPELLPILNQKDTVKVSSLQSLNINEELQQETKKCPKKEETKEKDCNQLSYFIPIILGLGVIILVLSKLYKNKK